MAEYHARECVRAANLTDDAENRELLLRMAREWAQEAQRRGSHASLHPDDYELFSSSLALEAAKAEFDALARRQWPIAHCGRARAADL